MDAASSMMAATASATSPTAARATATIMATRSTGASINDAAIVELDLLVMPASGVPMPATVSVPVEPTRLGAIQAGRQLAVTFEPAAPASTIAIDWSLVA